MEEIFSKASVIKLLKDGLKKPNPANPKKKMWTLRQLDIPSPGWKDVVTECEGNPLFKKGYQGVKFANLAMTLLPTQPSTED